MLINNINKFIGAGILLYSKNEKGKLVFLLGKERDGTDKKRNNLYCDFGGGRERNETPKQTAIREFSEESMDAINDINFFKKMIMNAKMVHNKNYYEYVIKIKYNNDIVKSFNRIIKKLKKCYVCNKYKGHKIYGIACPPELGLVEKTEFRWFTPIEILSTHKHLMRPIFVDTFRKMIIHGFD